MDQPAWLAAAWAELGVREAAGAATKPAITAYFREAGHSEVRNDATPWCAAFAGAMLKRSGVPGSGSLMARSYLTWGEPLEVARAGAVTVLSRGDDPAAGHVGFLIGATASSVVLLGGNQGDAVSVQAFAAGRVLGYRWPQQAGEGPAPRSGDGELFEAALRHVLEMEGGYSDDPYDPGGPTQYGITLSDYAKWQSETITAASRARLIEELRRITDDKVAAIYRQRYWVPASCAALPSAIALMQFDASVNHGVGGAIRMLQQAVGVDADGEIGPLTLAAAHAQPPHDINQRYAGIRRARYRALAHFWRFGRGWLRRVDATLAAASALERRHTDANANTTTAPPTVQATKGTTDMAQDLNFPKPGDVPAPAVAGGQPAAAQGKWWAHSKTIWGALITVATTVLPVLGPLIGINLPVEIIKQLGEQGPLVVQAVGGLLGTLLTIYGRTQAHQPIVRRDVRVRV